jgi:hypothetical protein
MYILCILYYAIKERVRDETLWIQESNLIITDNLSPILVMVPVGGRGFNLTMERSPT